MSQFNPTIRITPLGRETDPLAAGVLESLRRPIYRPLAWGVVPSALFTIVTLGVVPIIAMMRWLQGFIATQQQQLWHLAEWLRLQNANDTDTVELQRASLRIGFNRSIALTTSFFLAIAVGAVAMHFANLQFNVRRLFDWAYGGSATLDRALFTIAISAAAFCHLSHVAWHQQNVERYLRWYNQLGSRQGLETIRLPQRDYGLRPAWVIVGIAIMVIGHGALWAIPVMLAAGAHYRYVRRGSVQMRVALADRFRQTLMQRRPGADLARVVSPIRACGRPNCRASLPPEASFCPCCGAATPDVTRGVV